MSLFKRFLNFLLGDHYYHVWDGWHIHDHRVPTWIRECKECGRVEHTDYAGYQQVIEKGDNSSL